MVARSKRPRISRVGVPGGSRAGDQRGKWVLVVVLTVTAALLWAANWRLSQPEQDGQVRSERASAFWASVQSVLDSLALGPVGATRRGDVVRLELPPAVPLQLVHSRLERALRGAGAEILLAKEDMMPPRLKLVFGEGGEACGTVIIERSRTTGGEAPAVALVIDDLGYGMSRRLKNFLALPYKYTVAVIPGLKRSAEAAELAGALGKEVIVHMPMEPEKGEVEDNGFAVYTSLPRDEIAARVRKAIDAVPNAKGMNNHEGSKATTDLATMDAVMQELRRAGLYFLDSRTSLQSRAYAAARRAGVPALRSSGFLDAKDDETWIRKKFWELLGKAVPGSGVVMIAHPREKTLKVLMDLLPQVAEQGVRFVYASELAR